MLYAYIDESGHDSKGWVVLAGFVGREEQWNAFIPKWTQALGKRKSLHMRALHGWKKDRTQRLLARLGPLPYECGLECVMGGVRVADYADLIAGTNVERALPGYFACLSTMVPQILRGIPRDERLELVFEEQRAYDRLVETALPFYTTPDRFQKAYFYTSDGRPKLAKWSFVPKHGTILTQPADFLAFAVREHNIDKTSKKAQWCRPILQTETCLGGIQSREQTRRIVRRWINMNLSMGIA